ncbi:uncharacterized protein LOC110269264 [Arachis ipaensis]|uniref:uncharacterized protein LOC110269264 n=1 Tax=Arachis ipaensis TaxID=130454 RepID=UPI000A2B0A75|nr:uncharacterized protein LOC110269264 [Arachis ipaensis]
MVRELKKIDEEVDSIINDFLSTLTNLLDDLVEPSAVELEMGVDVDFTQLPRRAPPFARRPSPSEVLPSPFALRPSPVALRPSPFAFAFVTDGNHFFFILVIFIPFFSFLFFFESVRISLFTFKLQQTWATTSSSLFFSSKPSNSIDALLAMLWTYVVFFWNEKATKHGTLGALVQDSVKSHYETLFYCFPFPSPAPVLCFPGSPFISFDFISV